MLCGLKDNTYLLDGVPYHMNKHGFARDCVFEVVEHTDTKASFRLTDNEETRRMYPFSFTLTVTYTLEENRLIKCHRVENRSEQVMYYELGVHDASALPWRRGRPWDSMPSACPVWRMPSSPMDSMSSPWSRLKMAPFLWKTDASLLTPPRIIWIP